MTRSSKRMPNASSRSARWIALLTKASPCMPIMPRQSGWLSGKPPIPSSVSATGTCAFSANSMSACEDPERMTPAPARISGRSAFAISSAARARLSASGGSSSCSPGRWTVSG